MKSGELTSFCSTIISDSDKRLHGQIIIRMLMFVVIGCLKMFGVNRKYVLDFCHCASVHCIAEIGIGWYLIVTLLKMMLLL